MLVPIPRINKFWQNYITPTAVHFKNTEITPCHFYSDKQIQ